MKTFSFFRKPGGKWTFTLLALFLVGSGYRVHGVLGGPGNCSNGNCNDFLTCGNGDDVAGTTGQSGCSSCANGLAGALPGAVVFPNIKRVIIKVIPIPIKRICCFFTKSN